MEQQSKLYLPENYIPFTYKFTEKKYFLYVDMDGVLVDFVGGLKKIGRSVDEIKSGMETDLWKYVASIPGFWRDLEWMPGAEVLWSYISKYVPVVLSSPLAGGNCEEEKIQWVCSNLGYCPVILDTRKYNYACEGSILIDDLKEVNILPWIKKGGIGVHHVTVDSTIKILKNLGL